MKTWIWIAVLILVIILFSCQKQPESSNEGKPQEGEKIFPVAQEVESKISLALVNLEDGKAVEGAQLLLDAVLLAKPGEYLPEGFEDKILIAKHQFQSGNMGDALGSISEALLIIKPPSDLKTAIDKDKPEETEQVQKKEKVTLVAELVRSKILAASQQFKEGKADQGVELILEALVLFGPRQD
ncbi:MAG: hypothetical protein GTO17_11965 [Candidatus Aminicenantes bacterium]|nr:hypothetical protein [Candidatus Aminicenantes bacterium]